MARFCEILKKYDANVIHLEYDKIHTAGIAQVSLATPLPEKVELLLQHLSRDEFPFTVAWHGDGDSIDAVLGLKPGGNLFIQTAGHPSSGKTRCPFRTAAYVR